ncbi:MAG: zinc ABC transporter substrate-binding protein [Alphaproteobacteria bacterium]|nr:zinc ABC transporter substrate-binding protein [Alphaproteobacteria bacterium]MBL6952653.1 zinc ABC transporter substrate-binding protein [Alphaproteobacteria bacterium]
MRIFLLALFFLGAAPALAAGPKVVVTLKPVHSLVSGVMAGIGQPHLLLAAGADPHSHAMRPSEARALAAADAVFWIGPTLEGYLQKPLASLAAKARVVALSDGPGVILLPAREGGIWRQDHDHGQHEHSRDPHIWLDPRNAQAMVGQVVTVLAQLDPGNDGAYRRNGVRVIAGLVALEAEIARQLASVRALPYMVLHDAYQYFEARFYTNALGAIAVAPDRKPGARRIAAIRQRLAQGKVRCLFREAQFAANLVDTLTAGLDVRVAGLDPIGRDIAAGPDAYGRILRQLSGSMENCLSYSIGP